MEITYNKIIDKIIVQVEADSQTDDFYKQLDWIDIRSDKQTEIVDFLTTVDLARADLACIEHPENYPLSNSYEDTLIINLPISDSNNIYKFDYIFILLVGQLFITISREGSDLYNKRTLASFSEDRYSTLGVFLFHVLAIKSLAQCNANIGIARKRLKDLELALTGAPEEITSNELMTCERDINTLSDIIEDQYMGFEILSSLRLANLDQDHFQLIQNTIKGFQPLDKAMTRLEKKAESLRLQYMIIQQEKSTRKINLLTIIQAIFVPLTFIAGVYGMNFVNIPELNWQYAYFFLWLIFVIMAGGMLRYFFKKGWFD